MVQPMSPQDANQSGNVQGGVIMKLIDLAGAIVAPPSTARVCPVIKAASL
ncbi:MAG: hypothetical protein HQ588_05355 [Deltaproteobacteria bacterium]|nr:hypothetical protein [Deltaproteobacteria bacterium]